MQTVIMAGGEGKRLRPLTCSVPKPLLSLLEKPIIEYILDLLLLHSISNVTITTGYLGEKIKEHFASGKYRGIKIDFSHEDMPLGTAGSVRQAMSGKSDDVLVISGDALCDFDLSRAINFHRKRRPAVTIIGKRVDDPREYGLIETDAEGKVVSFLEKPDYSKVAGNIANTGVYIISPSVIEKIPKDEVCDFGRDVFPKLLSDGEKIAVYEDEGYWCDIGSIKTYISCQRDILKGKVKCQKRKEADKDENHIKTKLPPFVRVTPPVYIGEDVIFGKGVTIEAGSVLESGARILSGATIKGGVIGKLASLGERASVCGAIVCQKGVMKKSASAYEEAVIGEGATVGESSVILPFIKIWPYKSVDKMTVQKENLQFEVNRRELFDESGVFGETGTEMTADFSALLGKSIGDVKDVKSVFVCGDSSNAAVALSMGVTSGVLSVGANAYLFSGISKAEFLWEVENRRPDIAVYISSGMNSKIELFSSDSLSITRECEREIEDSFMRGEHTVPRFNLFGRLKIESSATGYFESLMKLAPDGLSGQNANIVSPHREFSDKLRSTLSKMGVKEGGINYLVRNGGMELSAYSEETGFVPFEKLIAVLSIDLFSRGLDIALPEKMPKAIDEIAESYSKKVLRYAELSVCNQDLTARRLAQKQPFFRDGAKLLVSLLAFFKRTGLDLKSSLKLIPSFEVAEKTVKIPETVASAISCFEDEERLKTKEGLRFQRGDGVVFLKPLRKGREIKIYAESKTVEFSKELAEDVEKILAGNLDMKRKK